MIIACSFRGRRQDRPRAPRQALCTRRASAGAAWTGWRRPPAAGDRLGALDVGERAAADAVDYRDRLHGQVRVAVVVQPVARVGERARRVHVSGDDHHQLIGDLEQPGEAGRARVEQGQRVVPGQLHGELDLVAVTERLVRGDDIEPRRARLGARVQAVRPGRPDVLRRLAREQLLKPGRGGTVAGQRAVVQVHRGYRVLAEAGQHGRGHERGHRLARAARAAEDEDPARLADGQARAVPVLRLLVAGAGTERGAVARDDLDLAAPGGVQVAFRAAERPFDRRQLDVCYLLDGGGGRGGW